MDGYRQGHSVIIDNPSLYASIPERGIALAAARGVPYLFIKWECSLDLTAASVERRTGVASQVSSGVEAATVRADPSRSAQRPALGALRIDTSGDLSAYIDEPITMVVTTTKL